MRHRNEHQPAAVGRRPSRPVTEQPLVAGLVLGAALVLAVTAGGAPVTASGAQAHPAEPHQHPDAQALENPVEATPESLATGRQRYVFMCRQCHGNTGKGDGDMSHAGGVPSDFTDDVWKHGETDGEIFVVIKEGVTADMQGYANRLDDEDIWHLVNYVKSLSR